MKKRVLLFIIFPLVTLIILASAFPYLLYKNQEYLTRKAIESMNEEFSGELVIEKSYISPFKNFPYVSIDLNHVKFFSKKGISEDTIKPIYEIACTLALISRIC